MTKRYAILGLEIGMIKQFLWQLGIIKNCPECNSNLEEVGHVWC
jgi:hypothetical protein